jgi:hypothetical protein
VRRLALLVGVLALACGGRSVEGDSTCEPAVVLANPGPSDGCFRVHAGEETRVRLAGDDGPGDENVDVHAGEAYEATSCVPAEETGPPRLEPCAD